MPHLSVDRTRTTMLAALGVAVLAWLAAWVATPLADPVRTGALDVLWAAVSGLAGAGALLAARMPGNEPCRRSLVFAGLGILAWACGQLAWTWYDLTRPEPPYPSLADVGYVLSLPLLAAALVAWPATARRFSRDDVLDAGLLGAAVVVCGVVLVIVPIFETHASDTLGLLYPSADILLVAAAAVALAFRGFAERGRLGLFALGMLALVAADAGYAFDAAGRYATGTAFYEAGWTLAFGILGLAVLLPPGAALRLRAPRGVVPVLVVALLGAAGTYQVLDELERGETGHLVAVALIDALLLVLAIRQMALARTRERESRRLAELTGRLEREAALRTATLQLSRSGVCVLDGRASSPSRTTRGSGSVPRRSGPWPTASCRGSPPCTSTAGASSASRARDSRPARRSSPSTT